MYPIKFTIVSCLQTLLFLVFFSINTNANEYTPMLTEEASWTQKKIFGWQEYFDYEKYALRGTTEIDGVVYQKMYVSYNSPIFDPCNAEFAYAMREENQQVYMYVPELDQEFLYIDFGLNVGDTATVLIYNDGFINTAVISISQKDSILVGNEYRDRLRVVNSSGSGFYEYWIEGVGGTNGIVRNHFGGIIEDAPIQHLACHQINGVPDYGFETCGDVSNFAFLPDNDLDQTVCMGQKVTFPLANLNDSAIEGGILPFSFSIVPETAQIETTIDMYSQQEQYSLTLEPEETTVYQITATDAIGFTTTKTVTITVTSDPFEPVEIVRMGEPGECSTENLTLTTSAAYDSYTWSAYEGGPVLSNEPSIVIESSPSTSWYVNLEVSNENGCSETERYFVGYGGSTYDVFQPNIEVESNSSSLTACKGEEVTCWSTETFFAYEWSIGNSIKTVIGTDDSITFTVPDGLYSLELCVFNEEGCSKCSNVFFGAPVPDDPIISFEDNELTTGDFPFYQWYFNEEPIVQGNTQSIVPTLTGNYTVSIFNDFFGEIHTTCPVFSDTYYYEMDTLINSFFFYALLEGAYNPTTGLMRTDLRDNCLLLTSQPYNVEPWLYEGTESVAIPADFPADAVDWVLVEMRTGTPDLASANTSIIERKAAILTANGLIVDHNMRPLSFDNLQEGESYYVVIRHRNHLDVLSSNPLIYGTDNVYDFRTGVSTAFGPEQLKIEGDGNAVLFAADYTSEGVIQSTDYDEWFFVPAAVSVYAKTDGNLDGVIQSTDYDLWYINRSKLGVVEIQY